MTLRVDEIYTSFQGEGPRVGIPTIFLRFGGCNLRCPGWPCDTQHAIDAAKYRKEWKEMSTNDIRVAVLKLQQETGASNICLTGGEPFLQPKKDLEILVDTTLTTHFDTVECFSNGTLPYPDWAIDKLSFIMDWKLPGSGENYRNENRLENLNQMFGYGHAVKFVIKGWADFLQAQELWHKYLKGRDIEVFAGVVWDTMTNEDLCKLILDAKLPWRLNVQVHNHIWPRDQRGK
jgi:7-carboxy-7-deazaguanine synthase